MDPSPLTGPLIARQEFVIREEEEEKSWEKRAETLGGRSRGGKGAPPIKIITPRFQTWEANRFATLAL